MTTSMPISAEELLKRYEDSIRKDPKTAIRMVMWLMIYDQKPSSWARDFLEEAGLLTLPKDDRALGSQLQKVRRWRNAAEKSVGLPPRLKRGATSGYNQALQEWERINPRPTNEELLSGWTPQPLPPTSGIEIENNREAKKSTKVDTAITPPKETTETKKIEEAALPKHSFGNIKGEDQNKKIQSEEPNNLLDEVDDELRAAGVLID